jgi:pheromone shutdown-related protein TraB
VDSTWYTREVTTVEHEGTTYYILGTAHVSQRSVEEVQTAIKELQPDVVCVELDQARHDALMKDSAFRDLDVFKVVREGKTLYLLAHLALSSYQRKIGQSLGVKPGTELLAAVKTAREANIPVELIDRDINITLKRTWKNLGLWKRSMLISSLLVGFEDDEEGEPVTSETVENLKEPKALSEMLTELGKAVPEVKGPLVDERDQFLTSKMLEAGRGKKKVLAVVGAAHVPGMQANIGQPIDREKLSKVPPPSLIWQILKWGIPIAFVVGMIYFWQTSTTTTLAQMMLAWILPTSIGAAGLTLLAGGSLLTVIAAFVVAPIAAIHPLLGTGMVTGIVEAWRRRPSVQDCERLPDDVQSLKGFWRNPVTRILLVAVASGLGTAVGFWVGVGWVASLL